MNLNEQELLVRVAKLETANWPLAGALALVFIINSLRVTPF